MIMTLPAVATLSDERDLKLEEDAESITTIKCNDGPLLRGGRTSRRAIVGIEIVWRVHQAGGRVGE